MIFNLLNSMQGTPESVNVFSGYNHNLLIGDGEFYDMKNMSNDLYPIMASGKKRFKVFNWDDYATDVKNFVKINEVIYGVVSKPYDNEWMLISIERNGEQIKELYHKFEAIDNIKMAVMGAQIVIIYETEKPQAFVYNTITGEGKTQGYSQAFEYGLEFTLCDAKGEEITDYVVSESKPTSPADGTIWMQPKTDDLVFQVYSSQHSSWLPKKTYIKLGLSYDEEQGLEDGDYIEMLGFTELENSAGTGDISKYCELVVEKLNGFHEISVIKETDEEGNDNKIILMEGVWHLSLKVGGEDAVIKKEIPRMDFMIEHNNRLWGCRYGENNNGDFVNEIYASRLGDASQWITYQGTSMDAYYLPLGSDGEFTGASVFGGYPIFFKENYIHRIYGTIPSNYQLVTTQCRGVKKGSGNSLQNINGLLYYHSPIDVCVYDGSLPTSISANLGDEMISYREAVASAEGNKYWISFESDMGRRLFCLDTIKAMWTKHEECPLKPIKTIPNLIGSSIWLTQSGTGNAIFDFANGEPNEWFIESGILGTNYLHNKYINKLEFRLNLEQGKKIDSFIEYDSSGVWEHIGTITGSGLQAFTLPILPRRCDHFRIKLSGDGDVKIFSITKTIKGGK